MSRFLAFSLILWGCSGELYQALLDKAAPFYELRVFVYSPALVPLFNYHVEVRQKDGGFHTYAVDPEGLVIFLVEAGESELNFFTPTMELFEKGKIKVSPQSTRYVEETPKVEFSHGEGVRLELGKISPVIPEEGQFSANFSLPLLTIRANGQKTEYPFLLTMQGGKRPYRFSLVSENTSSMGITPYIDRLRNLLYLNGSFASLPSSFGSPDGTYYLGSITILAEGAKGDWSHLHLPLNAHFKYVFVLGIFTPGDMSGITFSECQALTSVAKADCACQKQAKNAGLRNPEKFVAFLSTSTHSARCRLAGLGPGCTAPNALGGPWYRPIALPSQQRGLVFPDLALGSPSNPIEFDLFGVSYDSSFLIWTGSTVTGDPDTANCSDWTDGTSGASGHWGYPNSYASSSWTDAGSVPCYSSGSLYCFERD